MDRQTKQQLMARLERDALRICARFRLSYRALEPERANVKRRYGVCFSDGTIRIRLIHVTTKRPLKYSSLVNTLCHELAHLRHFNHGPRFQTLYGQILQWARRQGIYRPGPDRSKSAPVPHPARVPGAAGPPRRHTGPIPEPSPEPAQGPAQGPAASSTGQLELFG